MDLRALEIFLVAAETENLQVAAKQLRSTPSALSKSIAKIEEQLGVKLFHRVGRNIALSDHGRLLRSRGKHLLDLEQAIRLEVGGSQETIRTQIAGPEILMGEFLPQIAQVLLARFPETRIVARLDEDAKAIHALRLDSHLALTTSLPPTEFETLELASVQFETVVCAAHPEFERLTKGPIDIAEIQRLGFVSPVNEVFGKVQTGQSPDGWRDDEFPRRITLTVPSVHVVREALLAGVAIAYVPDYFALKIGASRIEVTGCPYSCEQSVYLCGRQLELNAHLRYLFSQIAKSSGSQS